MANEHIDSLGTHHRASLLDRGEHGVAGHRPLTIGKPTDGDVLRHSQSHALDRIENADGRVVVHGKESVGTVCLAQHLGGDGLRIGTVVADAAQALVERQVVLQQRILIAVETVLRDFQLHGRAVEGDALAAGLDEVAHSIEGTHIVVDHHAAGIDARADTVVEHQGHATVDQPLEMAIVARILGLRDDDATNLVLEERLADAHLALVALVALRHHDAVASRRSFLLNTREDAGEIEMSDLGHDDANHLHGFLPAVTQRLGQHVGNKIMFTRIRLYLSPALSTDARAVLQGTRDSGHRHAKRAGNVLHRYLLQLFHQLGFRLWLLLFL